MESKTALSKNLLCMACLCVEKSLHELNSVKTMKYYYDCISEITLCEMPKSVAICWECDAMLRRAVSFREQVKDSYKILQAYTSENLEECLLTDVSRPPRLREFINTPIEIVPDSSEWMKAYGKNQLKTEEPDNDVRTTINQTEQIDSLIYHPDVEPDTETKPEASNVKNKNEDTVTEVSQIYTAKDSDDNILGNEDGNTDKPRELQVVCIKDELKVEYNRDVDEYSETKDLSTDCSDLELESELQQLLDVKRNRTKSKRKTVKGVTKKRTMLEKRQGQGSEKLKKSGKVKNEKISTVKLSYEELLAERQRDSAGDVYVNAAHKCETCLVGFSSGKAHKSHILNKHSPDLGDYCCPICNTVTPTVESFTEHCNKHFKRYECVVCKKRLVSRRAVEQHCFTAHQISLKQYQCNLCGNISNSLDSHRYHKDTHKSRVQCPECEKTFSHRAGLMNHRLTVHELRNTFPCPVCGKVFRWKTSLKRHVQRHDIKSQGAGAGSGSGQAFCAACGIEFSSICSYKRHLRNSLKHVTRDQLKFICDHCNKRFADKTKLRDHIEEKHLHKNYHCHICDKSTKNRVSLDQHIRYVHNSRPNNKMCHYCGKGFPTKVQLESHIRTHTGERPFICEYCPTTFSQKSNLYKHNRQVHLNIKTKRYPLCKKRKEERKVDPILYAAAEVPAQKLAEVQKTTNCPELFVARGNNDDYIVGW